MTEGEFRDIMSASKELDINSMEFSDMVRYFDAALRFAKEIKPLIVKYSSGLPKETTFLFKMGEDKN